MERLNRFRFLSLALFIAIAGIDSLAFGQSERTQGPDIKKPGMDLGDFPNSAFTIPAGTCQMEFAPFTVLGKDRYAQPQYSTVYLFRYGVTDEVEFRLLGNGLTVNYTDPQSTGFSPVSLDMKVHLWDDKRDQLLPATSLEVVMTTDWGSKYLSNGYQPSIILNNDFPITDSFNLEWSIGYGEVSGGVLKQAGSNNLSILNQNVNQVFFQWSASKEIRKELEIFVTGQTFESVPNQTAGTTIAFGSFWQQSNQWMLYGLMGWGVTPDAPVINAQMGVGYAFGSIPKK